MANGAQTLTVSEIIDRRGMGGFQIWTVVLCGFVLVLDGFDAQVIGFLTPSIAKTTGIPVHTFGPILSASLIGLMVAAMATGPIADRWGRKWVVIVSAFSFGIFSLLTARASSFDALLILRFLTGLGLGAAMPNVVALASEYIPKRILALLVTLLFVGMPLGSVICGLVSGAMLPRYGWRSVFLVGGVVPLVISLLLMFILPESIQFLALRGKDSQRAGKILRKIAPEIDTSEVNFTFLPQDKRREGVPVKYLFTEGRAIATILALDPELHEFAAALFAAELVAGAADGGGLVDFRWSDGDDISKLWRNSGVSCGRPADERLRLLHDAAFRIWLIGAVHGRAGADYRFAIDGVCGRVCARVPDHWGAKRTQCVGR